MHFFYPILHKLELKRKRPQFVQYDYQHSSVNTSPLNNTRLCGMADTFRTLVYSVRSTVARSYHR